MINKILHQIWIGTYPIPEREIKFSTDMRENNPNYEYNLWTDSNLPVIPDRLRKMYDTMYSQLDFVYCADMVRWLVVYEYGGWYLDIDWEYIKSFDNLNIDNYDGILFGHFGGGSAWLNDKIGVGWTGCDYTFANNVFGFSKGHKLVKHMIDNMPIDYGYCNAPYSPGWTGIEVKKYLGLENEFTKNVWEYHNTVQTYLHNHNIEYGDYNTFQNEYVRHHALYAWSHENKEKFKKGLIK